MRDGVVAVLVLLFYDDVYKRILVVRARPSHQMKIGRGARGMMRLTGRQKGERETGRYF